jgi:copper chaperone CopZ
LGTTSTFAENKTDMKIIALSIATAFALNISVQAADVTAKISEVHLCCKNCVTGVEKAVGSIPGVKAEADQDSGTVTLTGADSATVQKAADALVKAGYFGKSSDPAIKINASTGATDKKVQTLTVEGVHLCCGKCVKAVDKALKSVGGVKEHTATKGAKSFDVTGDFNDTEVFAALQKEGLTGKVGK